MSASPSKSARHFTTTQVGKISEQIVASQLMLVSRGRLSPYWPLADDDGVDFLLKDKRGGRIHEFQIKTWFASEEDAPRTVQFDTGVRTFNEMSGGFVEMSRSLLNFDGRRCRVEGYAALDARATDLALFCS